MKNQNEKIAFQQMIDFFERANQRRILHQNIKDTSLVLRRFIDGIKGRLKFRRIKKEFLLEAFEREFKVLNEYYIQKAKKNKKLKPTLKMFKAITKKM